MGVYPTDRSEQPLAPVIQLHGAPPSCFTCVHAQWPGDGLVTHCTVYNETIESESYAAKDCFTYEYVPEGSQVVLDIQA